MLKLLCMIGNVWTIQNVLQSQFPLPIHQQHYVTSRYSDQSPEIILLASNLVDLLYHHTFVYHHTSMHYTLHHFSDPHQPQFIESILYLDLEMDRVYGIIGANRQQLSCNPNQNSKWLDQNSLPWSLYTSSNEQKFVSYISEWRFMTD